MAPAAMHCIMNPAPMYRIIPMAAKAQTFLVVAHTPMAMVGLQGQIETDVHTCLMSNVWHANMLVTSQNIVICL